MNTIAPKLFAIDYRLPDYYDSRLTDSAPYRQKMDEVQHLRPTTPLYFDAAAFDCAVALFTYAEICENGPRWVSTGPIENSLARNLEQLSPNDLLAVATYLMGFDRWEWKADAEQFVSSARPSERLNAHTVERLIESHLRLLVEIYMSKLGPFSPRRTTFLRMFPTGSLIC